MPSSNSLLSVRFPAFVNILVQRHLGFGLESDPRLPSEQELADMLILLIIMTFWLHGSLFFHLTTSLSDPVRTETAQSFSIWVLPPLCCQCRKYLFHRHEWIRQSYQYWNFPLTSHICFSLICIHPQANAFLIILPEAIVEEKSSFTTGFSSPSFTEV